MTRISNKCIIAILTRQSWNEIWAFGGNGGGEEGHNYFTAPRSEDA